jgi:hypothetical protein
MITYNVLPHVTAPVELDALNLSSPPETSLQSTTTTSISTMSTTDILLNSAALNSLKRNQLVSLCKMHGLKANGKNSDLIDKLQEYAMNNPKRERESAGLPGLAQQMNNSETDGGSDDVKMSDEENEGRARMRPSEIWEVIEEETVEEMRKIQEESLNSKGSYQSHRSKASQRLPGEFGAASTLTKSEWMQPLIFIAFLMV